MKYLFTFLLTASSLGIAMTIGGNAVDGSSVVATFVVSGLAAWFVLEYSERRRVSAVPRYAAAPMPAMAATAHRPRKPFRAPPLELPHSATGSFASVLLEG